ncbi:transforming growth factor-beta-induced protein ig-h3 [Strongylocentrotus purpuratus]|uniref:FAS1 domain-containing protein n=1 Tax=Strongylocentrotus purpuratus TaxID=7668 RepID=A0A7M7PAU3_STRPU|nr:transforming growth factor-beta-induced protein ig-h3 [Strongylocentrotus purpuratus]XP_797409.3 transforming growth factor-beta-induced protein ig-h3 [Strongylocentrotus purpuratus]
MQSLIAFLAVLVGVAIANPMVLSPAEQNQQNKAISAKEFLRKMFPADSMVSFNRSDNQVDEDIVGRLRALGLREAANIAEQVDLRQVLRDSDLSSVTLCMPSDKAVQKWRQELPAKLRPDQEAMKNLVKAWVVSGRVESSQISDNQKVQSLNGAKLRFNVYARDSKKMITVNGARVVDADRKASSGLIHVVDKVIYPLPVGNVMETLDDNKAFSMVVDLLKQAGLEDELRNSDPITVLVPTNAAFQALPSGVLDDLKKDPAGKLRNLLKYHVISDVKYSVSLSSGQRLRASQGDEITVARDSDDQILLNKQSDQSKASRVIARDIPTTNGVIQVIDRVILPPQKHFVLV